MRQMSGNPERRYRVQLIEKLTFELVPLKNLTQAIPALPPGAEVSITCSPAKGIGETIAVADQLRTGGHTVIPHIAARMVDSPEHLQMIGAWLRNEGIDRMFLVGGDATPPAGPYHDASALLRDLLELDTGLRTIGVTSYPDGHPAIDPALLSQALHNKQAMLAEAGVAGYASTQMCFDPNRITTWLQSERRQGMTLPIHLGIPGVVDRSKLMTMGLRLGVGTSIGYLRKNRKAIGQLLTRSEYKPDGLLQSLSPQLQPLGIEGLHCFTFNQVAATEAWRRKQIR